MNDHERIRFFNALSAFTMDAIIGAITGAKASTEELDSIVRGIEDEKDK